MPGGAKTLQHTRETQYAGEAGAALSLSYSRQVAGQCPEDHAQTAPVARGHHGQEGEDDLRGRGGHGHGPVQEIVDGHHGHGQEHETVRERQPFHPAGRSWGS